MQNHVLVPVDGTESKDEMLAYSQAIGSPDDTEITLVHVLPGTADASQETTNPPDFLQQLRDSLTTAGWSVNTELSAGDAVDEVIKLASNLPATLVLMSTHGRTGLERIREGSVTENVLKRCPCPVFILHSTRPEPTDRRNSDLFRRILVPLDGSEDSSAILGCVESFARDHGSEVVLFHDEMDLSPDDEPASILKMRAKLEDVSVKLANTGLKVSLDWTTSRRPIREILRTVDDLKIDLVAMATHGKDRKCRVMQESVTAEVIRYANCPLLVWSAEPQCAA
jgi:nucleotide-binding universal stress UspA family protein